MLMKNNNIMQRISDGAKRAYETVLSATQKSCSKVYESIGRIYQKSAEKLIENGNGAEHKAKAKKQSFASASQYVRSAAEKVTSAVGCAFVKLDRALFGSDERTPAKRRIAAAAAAVVLVTTAAVGGVIAYLTNTTDSVVNTFTMSKVSGDIEEDFPKDGIEKKDVVVSNSGDIPVYVRAAIVISWKSEDGDISPVKPVLDTDYTLDLGDDWTLGSDGFYYYKEAVEAGESTTNLINSCKVKGTNGDFHLDVYVLSNVIQAEPDEAVTECWGSNVTASNGTLTVK